MILPKILVWLREIFSQKSQEKIELLDRALQWMYLKLISPVANLLDKMEQEDKLIIVAPEVCSSLNGTAKSWWESLVCVDLLQLRACNRRILCCPIENTSV